MTTRVQSLVLILDYFLPLSTKLNKVEFDIYLNKTKAFRAIAPSSVAFHIILMIMKMMMLVMIMTNLAKRASPLSPIVRAILAIPKYSKFGLHTFGCNKHKVFYVSTLNKEITLG